MGSQFIECYFGFLAGEGTRLFFVCEQDIYEPFGDESLEKGKVFSHNVVAGQIERNESASFAGARDCTTEKRMILYEKSFDVDETGTIEERRNKFFALQVNRGSQVGREGPFAIGRNESQYASCGRGGINKKAIIDVVGRKIVPKKAAGLVGAYLADIGARNPQSGKAMDGVRCRTTGSDGAWESFCFSKKNGNPFFINEVHGSTWQSEPCEKIIAGQRDKNIYEGIADTDDSSHYD